MNIPMAKKAHVDCFYGITDQGLLACCLDTFLQDGKDLTYVNNLLKSFKQVIFDSPTYNKKSLMVTAVSKSSKTMIQSPLASFDGGAKILYNIPNTLTVMGDFTTGCKDLPCWVAKMTRCTITELIKAAGIFEQQRSLHEKVKDHKDDCCNKDSDLAYLHTFYLIASLLCLDSMNVREVTFSHLPNYTTDESSAAIMLKKLLCGVIINPGIVRSFDSSSSSILSTTIGIALLRVLSGACNSQQCYISPILVQKYGWGVDESEDFSLSIIVGYNGNDRNEENVSSLFQYDHVTHLESNLDDITGENLAFAINLLLKSGAIDAWVTPIVMKKGRPAYTLHCLCKDEDHGDDSDTNLLLKLIFTHTPTLGVRIYRNVPRAKLDRSFTTVETPFTNTLRKGLVDVKISKFMNGVIVRKKAEFDHCKDISTETGTGIHIVANQALMAYEKLNNLKQDSSS